jgi:hypothetical protein
MSSIVGASSKRKHQRIAREKKNEQEELGDLARGGGSIGIESDPSETPGYWNKTKIAEPQGAGTVLGFSSKQFDWVHDYWVANYEPWGTLVAQFRREHPDRPIADLREWKGPSNRALTALESKLLSTPMSHSAMEYSRATLNGLLLHHLPPHKGLLSLMMQVCSSTSRNLRCSRTRFLNPIHGRESRLSTW